MNLVLPWDEPATTPATDPPLPPAPAANGLTAGPGSAAETANGEAGTLALPTEVEGALWRASELGKADLPGLPTGFEALDAELPGGGWPCRSLTELLQAQPGVLEWRLLGPALRRVAQAGQDVVLVAPPRQPHLPGLRHAGLDDRHLVWVDADAPAQRLWCTEQLLRSNAFGALIVWLPQARPEQLRRLQIGAQACEGPVFVCRPVAAQHEASAAPLRLEASIGLDWALQVRIVKRRGPVHEDTLQLHSVPGGLHSVLTARTVKPSALIAPRRAPKNTGEHHAVGSPVAGSAPERHAPIQ